MSYSTISCNDIYFLRERCIWWTGVFIFYQVFVNVYQKILILDIVSKMNRKNSVDEAEKKAAEEKKNEAEAAAKKAEEEKVNAAAKAKADAEAAAAKALEDEQTNGKGYFEQLLNANDKAPVENATIDTPMNMTQRGAQRYGSQAK